MHATTYREVVPHDAEYEHASEDDDGVVHTRGIRKPGCREKKHDRSQRHPTDGDERAKSALRYQNSGVFHVLQLESHPKLQMTCALTHAPSENAPGVHPFSFLQIHRTAIGIENATY